MDDDGHAISYKLLPAGTPVHASGGEQVGVVDRVLENPREHIFDGIVIQAAGIERFVDAPEVGRITERRVTLTIDATEASSLPIYEPGAPEYAANLRTGRLGRLFGSGWKRRR
jgi:hypothetical protein